MTFLTLATSTLAFAPSRPAFVRTSSASSAPTQPLPYYASITVARTSTNAVLERSPVEPVAEESNTSSPVPTTPKAPPKKKPAKATADNHKDGILSPMVLFLKGIMGDEKLNKLRGKVISMHSDVIGSFVETSETAFGDAALRSLFRLTDKNGDGTISQEELQIALRSLGFSWLQEKQVSGIFQRADTDENGALDLDEWMKEAPKTLRTNLIKLAKKNGGDMGLLA